MPWRAPCDHFLNEGLPPPSLGRAQCIWSHTSVSEFSSGSAFLRSWLRILFNRDRLCGWSYQPIYQHRQAPKSMNRRRLNGGGTIQQCKQWLWISLWMPGGAWLVGAEGLVHICSHHTSSSYFFCSHHTSCSRSISTASTRTTSPIAEEGGIVSMSTIWRGRSGHS